MIKSTLGPRDCSWREHPSARNAPLKKKMPIGVLSETPMQAPSWLNKPPVDCYSSPTETALTRTTECSQSSSSSSSDDVSFCSDSDSSYLYQSSSSPSSSSSNSYGFSYQSLHDECTAANDYDDSRQCSQPVMTPEELIEILANVNANGNEKISPGFLTKHEKPPRLLLEELADVLCHINTNEAAETDICWDGIYNVVHQQPSVDDDDYNDEQALPIDELDIPDDWSTASSLSMGSCRAARLRELELIALNPIADRIKH